MVDTLRADHLAPYGGTASTPNISALAAEGQVFTHVSSSFHQTSMSMGSLFTGRTPSLETGDPTSSLEWTGSTWCGMHRFATGGEEEACIPAGLPTLARELRAAGYWTAGVTTNPFLFRPAGYDAGFDVWKEVGNIPRAGQPFQMANIQARSAPAANRAVERLLAARPSNRFFLYVHFMDVHDYMPARISYAQAVGRADRGIGQLLEILRRHQLLEGALVILVSDHGERLGEPHLLPATDSHIGNPAFEELTRVPLIVSPPMAGEDADRVMRGDDVFRLVLRAAGVGAPAEPDLEPDELYLSEAYWQTYRKGRWKSFRRRGDRRVHLVDLESDPAERQDVAGEHQHIVEEHARRMDELGQALASERAARAGLSDDERRRLEVLGYLE